MAGVIDSLPLEGQAAANQRNMKPGDVWCVDVAGVRHGTSRIKRGNSFCHVLGYVDTACKIRVDMVGHLKPGRPACPACVEALRAKPRQKRAGSPTAPASAEEPAEAQP